MKTRSIRFLVLLSLLSMGCSMGDKITVTQNDPNPSIAKQAPHVLPPSKDESDPSQSSLDLKKLSALQIVQSLNQGLISKEVAVKRLHQLLEAEKSPIQSDEILLIADAVHQLTQGSLFETLATIIGLPQKLSGQDRTQLKELIQDLVYEEDKRHKTAMQQIRNVPGTTAPAVLSPPPLLVHHRDAFLIRILKNKGVTSADLFSYIQKRIENSLDEELLKQWEKESAAGVLPYDRSNYCTQSNYLPHTTTDAAGNIQSYVFLNEKNRYLQELDLPDSLVEKSHNLIAEYFESADLVKIAGQVQNQWYLDTFHFILHTADFTPVLSGKIPPLPSESRSVLSSYFQIWNRYPHWTNQSIGNRIPVTPNQYIHLVAEAGRLLSQVKLLPPHSSALAQKVTEYITMIDNINHAFDIHPDELNPERTFSCIRRGALVGNLTDLRFFEVLAPFWDWLAFDPTGLESGIVLSSSGGNASGLNGLKIDHPLTRLYYFRALFSHHRDLEANHIAKNGISVSPVQWQIRNFINFPLDMDLGGELFLSSLSLPVAPMGGSVYNLDLYADVYNHDVRMMVFREIYEHHKKDFAQRNLPHHSVNGFTTQDQIDIDEYFHRYYNVEIMRFLLDEDDLRKHALKLGNNGLTVLDNNIRPGEATLRVKLLEEINDLLKLKHSEVLAYPGFDPKAYPQMIRIEEMLPNKARSSFSCGMGIGHCYGNIPQFDFKVVPGIYWSQNQSVDLHVHSAWVHPLAVFFAPGEYNFHMGGGHFGRQAYQYYVPGDRSGPSQDVKFSAPRNRILNQPLQAMAKDIDLNQQQMPVLTRPFLRPDLVGQRQFPIYESTSIQARKVSDEDPVPVSVLNDFRQIRDYFNP